MTIRSLKEFQRRFVHSISTPEGPPSPSTILDRIVPGGTLTPQAALGVYQTGYRVRLTEALGETFEGVWWVIGDTHFFRLAKDYLALHPSSFYNLSDFGEAFPDFLEHARPFADLPFLSDLARFEWIFKEVFHSAPHQPLSPEYLQHTDLSGATRLTFGASLRLFSSPYSVYEIWKLRTTPQAPLSQDMWTSPQCLLAYQHQQQVYVQRLSPSEHAIFHYLIDGASIGEALQHAVLQYPDLSPHMISNLFALVTKTGLLTGIITETANDEMLSGGP